jgi:hypothetical protein
MKWKNETARLRATIRRGWSVISHGVPLEWPHRMWLGTIFVIGLFYCYAFPPFQTNDEDAHWLHLWGVASGHLRCEGSKPSAAADFLSVVHQREVREDPAQWRQQYVRDALHFSGDPAPTTRDGTACRYPPHPYVIPGVVARIVAFGLTGRRAVGGMIRAAYAARITNWVLVSLAIVMLCRRVPWIRNFALFFYSIPEVIQQSMAVNTDSFLFVATALLLVLLFGSRPSTWSLFGVAVLVALMTMIKPVYAAFGTLGFIAWQRLLARHHLRKRDLAALIVALALPLVADWLWTHWVNAVATAGPPQPDRGRVRAMQQMDFLRAHRGVVLTLLWHQLRDFFGTDLMKGSWLSIFGAFGWSMFTMKRWAYYVLLVGCGCALVADAVDGSSAGDLEPPSRGSLTAVALASAAILVAVLGIIIGMYIYFSGAFLGRIGVDEVIGVQGRYYLIPILLWMTFLLYLLRRRSPMPRQWATMVPLLTTTALLLCVLANVAALSAVLTRFNSVYLGSPTPRPFHY